MRYLSYILYALSILPTLAYAGQLEISWQAVSGATGYKLSQSIDQGTTWTQIGDVTTIQTTITVPDDKLVLIRVSAYNTAGESIRLTSGIWYDRRQDKTPQAITVK